jgi:hypothetical protein
MQAFCNDSAPGRRQLMAERRRVVVEQPGASAGRLSASAERMVAAQALSTASDLFAAAGDTRSLLRGTAEALAAAPGAMCLVSLADGDVLRPYTVAHRSPGASRRLRRILTEASASPADAFSRSVQRNAGALRMSVGSTRLLRLWLPRAYWSYVERVRVSEVVAAALVQQSQVLGTVLLWRESGQAAYSREDQAYVQAVARRVAMGLNLT